DLLVSTAAFGNEFAPGLPYARGRIIRSTEDDIRKLRRAGRVIARRLASGAGVFNFSGLERSLNLDAKDLAWTDDEMAPALYGDRFRALALEHLGGTADRHDAMLFNRMTAATFSVHLALVTPGDVRPAKDARARRGPRRHRARQVRRHRAAPGAHGRARRSRLEDPGPRLRVRSGSAADAAAGGGALAGGLSSRARAQARRVHSHGGRRAAEGPRCARARDTGHGSAPRRRRARHRARARRAERAAGRSDRGAGRAGDAAAR